jgi:hypothetical protein
MAGSKDVRQGRYFIDDCLDEVHRVALGRPCPDRDHTRLRLIDIMRAILVPPRIERSGASEQNQEPSSAPKPNSNSA